MHALHPHVQPGGTGAGSPSKSRAKARNRAIGAAGRVARLLLHMLDGRKEVPMYLPIGLGGLVVLILLILLMTGRI